MALYKPELETAVSVIVPRYGSVLSSCFVPASILKVILCMHNGSLVHNKTIITAVILCLYNGSFVHNMHTRQNTDNIYSKESVKSGYALYSNL